MPKRQKYDQRIRNILKKAFSEAGITWCEICGKNYGGALGFSFAHSKKQRLIEGEEMFEVILVCTSPCHVDLDQLSHDDMYNKVKSIIEARQNPVIVDSGSV